MKKLIQIAVVALSAFVSVHVCAGTLGVYTAPPEGFDTHTFYYDDGKEVTIIDTQFVPALTEKMVEKIKSETKSRISRVIVTHPNPDKFNGLAYLHAMGVSSITSADVAAEMPKVHAYKKNFWVNVMKSFKENEYPKFENAQQTFVDKTVITLKSGETLTLTQLQNPGIATTQIVVRIDATGDLIVGDLVHHKAHAWLEGGLVNGSPVANLDSWRAALTELHYLAADYPQAKIYGGRGEFVKVEEAIAAQREYLAGAQKIVDQYLSNNRENIRKNTDATAHYKALTNELSKQYPDYSLPYMVQYSVYGLFNTRKQFFDTYAALK